ncbi:MAG: F0F1 ATP synthase subunit C [Candidatus Omnitrophota bacterium]|jgi:F0F1-type ATP synthase membrane subunit c/vacuolar-type H+-ATPase subunit K|nr:F0F1 ATP synthase subunit C [Candidatus Omnitrophota bacterium]
MQNITVILMMLLCTAGPAAVVAVVGYAAIKGVARNPSASPRILLAMIVAFFFAEAIAVMALLMVFNLFR